MLLLLGTVLVLSGCFPTRHVPEGQHLLVKSKIKVDDPKVDKDELYTYLKQRPNRKILGLFRFHLGA